MKIKTDEVTSNFTSRFKLSDVQKDNFDDLKEEYNLKDDAELIRKSVPAEINVKRDVKEAEGTLVGYITSNNLDRDHEIVVAQGIQLTQYRKNPVVLLSHNYYDLPIGKNLWIKADENKRGLIAKTKFAGTDEAQKVYNYVKDEFPIGLSIGFIPLEIKYKEDFDGLDIEELKISKKDLNKAYAVITRSVLLEYSLVAVPANPEALSIAVKQEVFPKEWDIKLEDIKTEGEDVEIEEDDIAIWDDKTEDIITDTEEKETETEEKKDVLRVLDAVEEVGDLLKTVEKNDSEEEEKVEQINEDKLTEMREKLDTLTDLVQSLIIKVQNVGKEENIIDIDEVTEEDKDDIDIDPEQIAKIVSETMKELSPDFEKLLEDHRKRLLGKIA